MKKIFTGIFLLIAYAAIGQDSPYVDYNGYQPTGEVDTIKVMILIADCSEAAFCPARQVQGYAVRRKYTTHGMPPNVSHWEVDEYLDRKRKSFPDNVVAWGHKRIK